MLTTLVGFIITIWNVSKSKTAAKQARMIVEKVRDDMKRIDTMSEFASAITAMEEIKRLQRVNAWVILPDRYGTLKKQLITIRGISPDLNDKEKANIQSMIQHISNIEKEMEENLSFEKKPDRIGRLNNIMNDQIKNMQQIMVDIKNRLGRL